MILDGLQIFLFTKSRLDKSINTLLEKGRNTNGTITLFAVFPFVKALGTIATKKPPSKMLTSRKRRLLNLI